MDRDRVQRDAEFWAVLLAALQLQHRCELAGMEAQAKQAREIRAQANLRLAALYATRREDQAA